MVFDIKGDFKWLCFYQVEEVNLLRVVNVYVDDVVIVSFLYVLVIKLRVLGDGVKGDEFFFYQLGDFILWRLFSLLYISSML